MRPVMFVLHMQEHITLSFLLHWNLFQWKNIENKRQVMLQVSCTKDPANTWALQDHILWKNIQVKTCKLQADSFKSNEQFRYCLSTLCNHCCKRMFILCCASFQNTKITNKITHTVTHTVICVCVCAHTHTHTHRGRPEGHVSIFKTLLKDILQVLANDCWFVFFLFIQHAARDHQSKLVWGSLPSNPRQ